MIEEVSDILRRAARRAVLPLFQHLAEGDVKEKAPGDVVTVADHHAEVIIAAGLRELLPDSTVIGEEGVAADPAVLDRLLDAGPVWLVDPVDGTANFAAGRGPFKMMVALLRGGVTEAGWILDPRTDSLAWAQRGSGAYLDGVQVRVADRADPVRPESLRGSVASRFLPQPLRSGVERRAGRLGKVLPSLRCAGQEYPNIVDGTQDFALFWRTLPWDHAPGALFAEEAGGVVRGLDGSSYGPTRDAVPGLLAAASEDIWREVHGLLFPGERPVGDRPTTLR
jgi:fructose-1,6-bisphosphatase/inositol monophosphatase family enzyme